MGHRTVIMCQRKGSGTRECTQETWFRTEDRGQGTDNSESMKKD